MEALSHTSGAGDIGIIVVVIIIGIIIISNSSTNFFYEQYTVPCLLRFRTVPKLPTPTAHVPIIVQEVPMLSPKSTYKKVELFHRV